MTSSITSQGGLKVGPLYSSLNEITCFTITKKRTKISLNFLCKGIMRLWLHLYKSVFMTSLMRSPGHKVGQLLKLMYPHQYFSKSVDQKSKISEIPMAILLVYSTSGITSGKKVCCDLKMAAILKHLIYYTQLQFDIRYDMKRPSQI